MAFDKSSYDNEYIKANQRQFLLKVNRIHEADMVKWLESQKSIQTYLKALIRADMEKQSASVPNLT